jgi:hypothetical protein
VSVELINVIAGIGWEPEIRGILTVLVGFVVLMGSTYLLVATNTGARLGMLISLAGLFGFMVVLTLFWWLVPPGIGPRGNPASWQPVEVYVEDQQPPQTDEAAELPRRDELPDPEQIVADNAEQLEGEFARTPVLSDIAGVDPDLVPGGDELGGWTVVSTANAGEAQATADEFLVEQGLFESAADYVKLDAFETGGKPKRTVACPDDGDLLCRAWHRIKLALTPTHPPHFAVVQVQPVLAQEAVPGAAPPLPVADESQPVVSVVMVRDLGSVRQLPATYFVISLALFIVFALMLHYREKTLERNLAHAKAVEEARS